MNVLDWVDDRRDQVTERLAKLRSGPPVPVSMRRRQKTTTTVFATSGKARLTWIAVVTSASLGMLVLVTIAWLPTFGGGWVWPHGTSTIGTVLGGLFSVHPGHGLPPLEAKRVPAAAAVYVCVVVLELLFIAALVWVGVLIVRRFRNDGMATRWEAQQALGEGRLHEAKAMIRPDLYGRDRDKERA